MDKEEMIEKIKEVTCDANRQVETLVNLLEQMPCSTMTSIKLEFLYYGSGRYEYEIDSYYNQPKPLHIKHVNIAEACNRFIDELQKPVREKMKELDALRQ